MAKSIIGRDLPFSSQICKFIDEYVGCQDLEKSAIAAGFPEEMGRTLWKRLPVREEIEARIKNVKAETDKLIAKKRVVNVEALDKNLMQVVTIPRKTLIETPSLATPKVNAIEMGYKRIGMLIDDNFIPDTSSGPAKDEAPRIFRAAEQSIITHQITETRQTVTTRAVEAPLPPVRPKPASPPTIDATDDPWSKF